MPAIPASKVVIRCRYLVLCEVCQDTVTMDSGGVETREDAKAAKVRHLQEHAEEE